MAIWERFAAGRVAPLVLVAAEALFASVFAARIAPTLPLSPEDFSHLLAADTFGHGRLANPALPSWQHFETPWVIQQPRYASAAPPLQGLVLALGSALGNPLFGARLCFALACAAVTWMLRAWTGAGWALAGGLLLALHPQLALSLGNVFSGGPPATLGAALVWGAAPRLRRGAGGLASLLLGLGAGLLLLSRPLEGAAVGLPLAIWLARAARRSRAALWPAAAAALASAGFLGLHNLATTGSPWTTPSSLHDARYASAPAWILLERPPDKSYAHASLAAFFGAGSPARSAWEQRRSWGGFAAGAREKLSTYWHFFLLPALSLPLLALPWVLREPGVRLALAAAGLFAALALVETAEQPRFAAPLVAPGALVGVACLRRLWRVRPRRLPLGPLLVLGVLVMGFQQHSAAAEQTGNGWLLEDLFDRPSLIKQMQRYGPRHLVFVDFAEGHSATSQWVHNEADLEAAGVVWARQISPSADRELAEQLPRRRLWLLRVRQEGTGLRPHPGRHDWRAD